MSPAENEPVGIAKNGTLLFRQDDIVVSRQIFGEYEYLPFVIRLSADFQY